MGLALQALMGRLEKCECSGCQRGGEQSGRLSDPAHGGGEAPAHGLPAWSWSLRAEGLRAG